MSFKAVLCCYSVSMFAAQAQRDSVPLEKTDKLILPASALETIARLAVTYPLLFEIYNPLRGKKLSCGVLEFSAEEGCCHLPFWVMQNLEISEGQMLQITSANLPKGKFVRFQPQTSNFLDISNPKAVLENALRGFSCLTNGETIRINYNNRNYDIGIVEVESVVGVCPSVSIIETDLQVDFAPPADYREPPRVQPAAAPTAAPAARAAAKAPASTSTSTSTSVPTSAAPEPVQRVTSFSGTGFRLDGRATTTAPSPTPAAATAAARPQATAAAAAPPPSSSAGGPALTFGRSTSLPGKAAPAGSAAPSAASSASAAPPAAPKFVAFSGSGRSLRD